MIRTDTISSPIRARGADPGESFGQPQTANTGPGESFVPPVLRLSAGDSRLELSEGQSVRLGRSTNNDVTLPDNTVSRQHAVVRMQDGQAQIRDVGSSNGTFVAEQRIEPGQWHPIPPNASVRLGESYLEVEPAAQFRLLSGDYATHLGEGSTLTIGRAMDNGLVLPGGTVSRRHALARVQDGQLQVQDLGSTNGTTVDGRPVAAGQWTVVPAGAELSIGACALAVQGQQTAWAAAIPALPAPLAPALGSVMQQLATATELESKPSYQASIAKAMQPLSAEKGLVELPKNVPTVVVSDLHARRDFLLKILEHPVEGERVLDRLQNGTINLLFLGDGMHSEARGQERWQTAEQALIAGDEPTAMQLLDQEMLEGLGTMKMVMELKAACPENVHFLRGNHDEVNGKYAKYARMVGESELVRHWMTSRMGADFVDEFARFENELPLMAVGNGFVASHSAPGADLTRAQIESKDLDVAHRLNWTENSRTDGNGNYTWETEEHSNRLDSVMREAGAEPGSRWFVGHRPVRDGLYRDQFGGRLIQLNAPDDYVVAVVPARGGFQPERDVVKL